MKTGYIRVRANNIRKPTILTIPVQIVGTRKIFGRVDYLVTPCGGEGEAWVISKRVKEEIER